MPTPKKLLAIVELGGYPDFTPLYRELGFEVHGTTAMRKALALIKKVKPDVVVAEFVYGPTYGARISNLETLFAGLQRDVPQAAFIVFLDRESASHLEALKDRFPIFERLYFPIDASRLRNVLQRIIAQA